MSCCFRPPTLHPPTTPNQLKWDQWYLKLAKFVSQKSKDPSTKVGAVAVNWDHSQEFTGYNGFAKGVHDLESRYNDRPTKYKFVVHAEANAIIKALRANMAEGATLYVYPAFMVPPICNECAKLAIQAGISEVVGYEPNVDSETAKRWEDAIGVSRTMFQEAGVTWRVVPVSIDPIDLGKNKGCTCGSTHGDTHDSNCAIKVAKQYHICPGCVND